MQPKIHIKHGHLIDPANNIDTIDDIYIANGCIAAIGQQPAEFVSEQVIDASGLVVCPGFIDLYTHAGSDPHSTINLANETAAAAHGGITTLCCPPDTKPLLLDESVAVNFIKQSQQLGWPKVLPLGALTKGLKGEVLTNLASLSQAGCVAFSNAEIAITDNAILRNCFEYAASLGLTLFLHCQDPALAANGCAHAGEVATRLGLTGIPETAETVTLARDLLLIEQTGVKAHICKLSTARGVEMIAAAKARGMQITASVAIQNLHLTEMDLGYFNSYAHLSPPLRSLRDQQALLQSLYDGVIDTICSDHRPLSAADKLAPFAETTPGASVLDVFLPLNLRLGAMANISLSQIIGLLTYKPANILAINAGHLSVGASADICIFDAKQAWTVDTAKLQSAGKNSPYLGWDMCGKMRYCLVAGNLMELNA